MLRRIGSTTKVTTCGKCGKRKLGKTIVFEQNGRRSYLGQECASKVLKRRRASSHAAMSRKQWYQRGARPTGNPQFMGKTFILSPDADDRKFQQAVNAAAKDEGKAAPDANTWLIEAAFRPLEKIRVNEEDEDDIIVGYVSKHASDKVPSGYYTMYENRHGDFHRMYGPFSKLEMAKSAAALEIGEVKHNPWDLDVTSAEQKEIERVVKLFQPVPKHAR